MPKLKRIYPSEPGHIEAMSCGRAIMPYSEVCMHMKIAGKPMYFQLIEIRPSRCLVQLYDAENQTSPWFSPILPSEAGLFQDDESYYYYTE